MKPIAKRFFLGFISIHILHHAAEDPVYGLWLIEELKHHGYDLSPGTIYPILHALKVEGLIKSRDRIVEGKVRKYYETTTRGRKVLTDAKNKIRELVHEVL